MPDSEDSMLRLLEMMRLLRSENGCPWDREQTLGSLRPYLLEETYEVLEAMDGDRPQDLCEELGDLLLQIVFQSQIAAEEGLFTFEDVARGIGDKLERRHPHVFGDLKVESTGEVLQNWEAIKREEKGSDAPRSVLDGIPRSLPALQRADQVQKKAARVGFDWDDVQQVFAKLREEIEEVEQAVLDQQDDHVREELGDLLFAAVNVSRFLGHSAEDVLHLTIRKFTNRFVHIEQCCEREGKPLTDCSLQELDVFWEQAKRMERDEDKS